MTPTEQIQLEGRVILRVSHEFREWLSFAKGEPEADSLLRDFEVIDRIGRRMTNTHMILISDGIPAAGSAALPSIGTCRNIPNIS